MTTVICLSIATIIGTFCAPDANVPQSAECWDIGPGWQHCYVEDAMTLPLFLSYYDPTKCQDGATINCDSDPDHLGDMTPVNDCTQCMACPIGWYDRYLEFAGEVWHCRDHGPSIVPTYRRTYTAAGFVTGWVIYVDLLAIGYVPQMVYELVDWEYVK